MVNEEKPRGQIDCRGFFILMQPQLMFIYSRHGEPRSNEFDS